MSIEQPFRELGNHISNLPHVIIDKRKISTQKPIQPQQPQPIQQPQYPQPIQPKPQPLSKQDILYEKIRSWAFIIIVLSVIGYAVYRIFFG